jgi:hypothetical protein
MAAAGRGSRRLSLSADGTHPLQIAWQDIGVPVRLLPGRTNHVGRCPPCAKPKPTDDDIDQA